MRYRIRHRTTYRYDVPANLCHNEARLRPLDLPGQRCLSWKLVIDPEPEFHRTRLDSFGNHIDYFSIQRPHPALVIAAESEVEVLSSGQFSFEAGGPWEQVRENLLASKDPAALDARAFALPSPLIPVLPALADFAREDFTPGRCILEATSALNSRIFRDFKFDPDFTTVATPVVEVLENRRGVCQDFAQLMIAALRSIGLPARYVSGYLETLPPPGKPKLVGADASHAWVSVFVPGEGWLDFDPTNNIRPGERHITVATGRDYRDVSPLRGITVGGASHSLKVSVDVSPL
ncbi:transglutaminase family protein [Luteolibacter marinus]|uniref:transglutaminase family protein n=1 Tax=Luteolibacter marinus TaxID=2776705 RepID=UPI0018668B77|nr:transglutaminase family protein [Luteolibacter marinus]